MRGRGILLVAALLAGCAGDDGVGLPSAAPTSAPPAPTASATPSPTPSPMPPPSPVTLAFAGDVHFEGALRARLEDPATALAPIATQLGAADLTVVNLETSVGTSGTPEPGKRFTFQAPPSALTALHTAGVDVVTMANNHAMDFGPDGLTDTLAATAAARPENLDVVGVGANLTEAFAPALRNVRGTTVAVIGANVPDDPGADPTAHWAARSSTPGVATALDPAPLLAAVTQARATADVVVVYLHWGVQGESCPSPSQTALASALAGQADIVVGSHAHLVQGAGLAPTTDTYVAYGLGNFVWYTPTEATGMLTVTVENGAVTAESWSPATIGADGLPSFTDEGDAADDMFADRAALRECTDLRPLP
ncbi:CapA family protein [Jiangella mangrovi]|uniref:Poly-gamma-glutamate synthesis protein (Capsule biosynthesis protein) n=1 Tax=Jiangella mangrovi TaxID=1524084 RepID=A0A7W9LLM1_9ACTN|nr:CapA family protein [Jiangella mangrovi]MBB5788294.1 poly-gamma-glutamate synthesis protein (capsule biosynthesis protein) [Jiangella mangrovi]